MARFHCDWWLVTLLTLSLILRILLAKQGGQLYFPDESRINAPVDAATAIRQGNVDEAVRLIFSTADHLGFKLAMTVPAWAWVKWGWSLPVLAMLGSGIFSTASIACIYALARRAGAGVEEARWAAGLMAGSTSMFYWAPHLMPYDMALCLGLACLFVSIHPAPRWYHSLLAGALGFCTFATYNGYWLIVAFALTVHVLQAWPMGKEWKAFLLRGGFGLIGLVVPFLTLIYWAAWGGFDLLNSYLNFSRTISQGDYNEGHRIIVAYLWTAENGLLLLWIACLGWFLWRSGRGGGADRNRARLWLAGLATIGLTLVLGSNVFEKFVVYGRLVRQMVPFFCLLGGWAMADFCVQGGLRDMIGRRAALLILIMGLAGFNFGRVFQQDFNFSLRANRARTAYLAQPGHTAVPADKFMLLYAGFIWPLPPHYDLPPHEVLLSWPHPLQFKPFLYEGYNRQQRAAISSTDITARLILLKN